MVGYLLLDRCIPGHSFSRCFYDSYIRGKLLSVFKSFQDILSFCRAGRWHYKFTTAGFCANVIAVQSQKANRREKVSMNDDMNVFIRVKEVFTH